MLTVSLRGRSVFTLPKLVKRKHHPEGYRQTIELLELNLRDVFMPGIVEAPHRFSSKKVS